MQASFRWSPPRGTLGAITREAEARAELLERQRPALAALAAEAGRAPSLRAALRCPSVALLTEVKRCSPSKGAIAPSLDAVAQATAYLEGGAAGVSVLTEPAHFGGSDQDLVDIRAQVLLPALKKDFHVAPIQLLQARALGASAALIIARAVSPDRLAELLEAGRLLELELLVEVRDEAELELALANGALMIGVNNRDLETLVIDPATSDRIIPLIPDSVVAIAESGVSAREHVERYAAIGADAVLVGSSLSSSPDPAAATRALAGVARRSRAG